MASWDEGAPARPMGFTIDWDWREFHVGFSVYVRRGGYTAFLIGLGPLVVGLETK